MSTDGQSQYASMSEDVFAPLEEVLIAAGRGIAKAQKELDFASLEIQKEIDSDPTLSAMGLEATWYAIPETELNLKITLSLESKISSSGSRKTSSMMRISPVNATFQNQFGFSEQISSELRVKIMPVPKPSGATKMIPDVIGLTSEEATKVLTVANFKVKLVKIIGTVKEGQQSEVKKVTPSVGTLVAFDYDKEVEVEYV